MGLLDHIKVAGTVEVPHNHHPITVHPPQEKRRKFPFVGFIDFQGLKIDVENRRLATLTCVDCGASREVFLSQIGTRYKLQNGVYRCGSCFQQARRDGTVPPARQRENITRTCASCGAQTPARRRQAESGKPYHCRRCYLRLRAEGALQQQPSRKVDIACPDCGKIRSVKPSHARKLNGPCGSCARKGVRGGSWAGGNVMLACTACGASRSFRPKAAQEQKTPYLCNRCCKPSGEANHAWKGGASFAPYPPGWKASLRKMIRERDGNMCRLCVSPGTGRELDVHHIDYDKDNLDPLNLVALCKKCHPKTNFNREHWKQFFENLMRGAA